MRRPPIRRKMSKFSNHATVSGTDTDMQAFRYLALVLLLSLGPACLAGELTIRVINANDGRPLKNQPVSISLLYEKGETTPQNTTQI